MRELVELRSIDISIVIDISSTITENENVKFEFRIACTCLRTVTGGGHGEPRGCKADAHKEGWALSVQGGSNTHAGRPTVVEAGEGEGSRMGADARTGWSSQRTWHSVESHCAHCCTD